MDAIVRARADAGAGGRRRGLVYRGPVAHSIAQKRPGRKPAGRRLAGAWAARRETLRRFFIVGFSAALVNLGLMAVLVEWLGFRSYLLKNTANLLAIEASIFYSFIFNRAWTWDRSPRRAGRALFLQFLSFNLTALVAVLFRVVLFALLERVGLHYLVNVAVGIALAAGLNYFFCERFVFRGAPGR